MTVKSSSSTLQ